MPTRSGHDPFTASAALILVLSLVAGACGSDDPAEPTTVAFVEVTPTDLVLVPGERHRMVATPRDANGNAITGKIILWESRDPGVATVDGSGEVTGISGGIATIRATVEGVSGSAGVVVENPAPTLTALDPDSVIAGRRSFTVTAIGSDFVDASDLLVDGEVRPTTFVSANELQATISEDDVREAGNLQVTVRTPEPGGGVSDPVPLKVVTCETGGIAAGESGTGSLAAGDCSDDAGAFFDEWSLDVEFDDRVEVDVTSPDFDPRVHLDASDGVRVGSDDDSGPGDAARLAVVLPTSGDAIITVTSAAPGATGAYTVESRPLAPLAYGDSARGTIPAAGVTDAYGAEAEAGDGVLAFVTERGGLDASLTLSGATADPAVQEDGTLEGGEEVVVIAPEQRLLSLHVTGEDSTSGEYTLHLRRCRVVAASAGSTLSDALAGDDCSTAGGGRGVIATFDGTAGSTVTLEASSSFDNRLALWGPAGELLARDDDGGGGTDARIVVTLPVDGTHAAVLSAAEAGATGDFTLDIASSSPAR